MKHKWDSVIEAASGEIRRLSYVWRFSSIAISVPENVAEHSFWVSIYAAMIHEEIYKLKPVGERNAILAAIIMTGLTHDVAEAVTGDFVRTFKHSDPKLADAINTAEVTAVENRMEDGIKSLMQSTSHLAEEAGVEYVKAVVKAADFMSLHAFMMREWMRGNQEFKPNFEMMIGDLASMGEKQLCSKFDGAEKLSDLYYDLAQTAADVSGYRPSTIRKSSVKNG